MRGIHHHSVKKLTKKDKAGNTFKNIWVKLNNMERYVSFQLGNLRFGIHYSFLGGQLKSRCLSK